MARRKPASGKARKEHLQFKRAQKRDSHVATPFPADADAHSNPLNPATNRHAGPSAANKPARRYRSAQEAERAAKGHERMKLESRFLRLPLELVEYHRRVSATERLVRPIPEDLGVLHVEDLQPAISADLPKLTCPARPKWRYSMTKLEVEKNEEGMFNKWLNETDSVLSGTIRSSPTFFERNLHVWRQLWRVTEVSDILCILVDVRFPLIHYPPALETYVKGLRDKKVVIVLTKTDLVPRWLSEAWQQWFEEREGPDGAEVVLMESYREIEKTATTQGTQARCIPAAPPTARAALLDAFRRAHEQLLTPPPAVASHPERLARWHPRVRREVDWDAVETEAAAKAREAAEAGSNPKKTRRKKDKDVFVARDKATVEDEAALAGEAEGDESEHEGERGDEREPEREGDDAHPFISVGLIGQPNVGKSSLLNALLGRKVVRASRTPGKTKTLQTIFWNKTVRLVDCPGLVCPSFAGMERQVVSGIIPIQNVEPVSYFLAQRMPLESILKLIHPDADDLSLSHDGGTSWTTDEILSEYATQQNFVTAKAGRPDLYRAGAFLLRQLHASSIPWGFRPPFAGDAAAQGDQEGIYLPGFQARASTESALERERALVGSGDDYDSEDEDGSRSELSGSEEETDSEGEEESAANEQAVKAIRGTFAALIVEGSGSDGDDDDAEEEDDE